MGESRQYRWPQIVLRSAALALAIAFARAQNVSLDLQAKITPIFQEARAAERRGDFRAAAALYAEILRLAPGVAEVWTNRGLVLLQLGRNAEALTAFQNARRLNPRLAVPHLFIGIEYGRTGRTRDAVAELEKAVELDPGNTKAAFELGRAYVNANAYDSAVSVLSRLTALSPNDRDAPFTLGLAYLRWSRSVAQRMLARESAYRLIVSAESLAVSGFEDPAAERYRRAIGQLSAIERAELPVDPTTFRARPGPRQADASDAAWMGLQPGERDLNTAAARAWNRGQYSRALQAAKLRLRQADDPRAMYWLLLTTRALARETLLRAIQLNPESGQAHLILAEIAKQDGDNDRVVHELAQAARAEPQNADVRLVYIQFLLAVQNEAALAQSRQAAAAFPDDARINCEFGRALLKNGFAEEALPIFARAAATDPKLAPARAGLADAYGALGRLDEAVKEMRTVLAEDKDGAYHYRIGRWYQQLGRDEDAREAFAETARIKAAKVASLEGRLKLTPDKE